MMLREWWSLVMRLLGMKWKGFNCIAINSLFENASIQPTLGHVVATSIPSRTQEGFVAIVARRMT